MRKLEEKFHNEAMEIVRLFKEKAIPYGKAWYDDKDAGLKMRFSDIYRKYLRLKNMIWETTMTDGQIVFQHYDELLNDTIDIAAYALMMRLMLKKIKEGKNEQHI